MEKENLELKKIEQKSVDGNHWKPTEKQLRELRNVFNADTDSWDEDVLESLYNDLKKL